MTLHSREARQQPQEEAAKTWYNKALAIKYEYELEETLLRFDKALEMDLNYILAWYNKGQTLPSLDKFTESTKLYEKYLKLAPKNNSWIWYDKAWTLAKLGEFDEAIKCYE
jgi:tetratricopeptide (TPR) repeat protein